MDPIPSLIETGSVDLSVVSLGVLGAYLVMLLVIGYYGYRRSVTSEEDYYLARRQQGWVVSSLTIMATFFSSFALLGVPGMVYKEGVVLALFALNVPVAGAAVYVLGSRISRLGRARNCVTPADLLSQYYDSPVAMPILLALVGFLFTVPYVVMQINAGGIISQVIFPEAEYSFEIGTVILAVITMIYIMVGGMRSVSWTDVIQGALLIGGMLLAGLATVAALGGIGGFFEKVSHLPPRSLAVPGVTGSWTAWKLFTVVTFAALGSIIQPAQWIRFYSARSTNTLRRSALIFGTVLTISYLFGVMLVGLGGQSLFPIVNEAGHYLTNASGQLIPHPAVGSGPQDFDKILVVVLKSTLPSLLGPAGVFMTALFLMAIMGASMSTADSNLHALSAVVTRDVYGRYIRPGASQRERTWVGRSIIAIATVLALILIFIGRTSEHFNPVAMIAQMALLAISFATQLLPLTVDMLFLNRGSRAGAVAGLITGLAIVFAFTPFFGMLAGEVSVINTLRNALDTGAVGLIGNVAVFAIVSAFTRRLDEGHVARFREAAEPPVAPPGY
ncbi:MAG: sodium:solute symporter family protein [Fidelibacterota bacterium]|nr:MAG: sodium:solute symporter family protein [Candidatus Neomarinimicrobiota bacterium]